VMVPVLIAVVGATLVARRFDLRSIYTARSAPPLATAPDPSRAPPGPDSPATG